MTKKLTRSLSPVDKEELKQIILLQGDRMVKEKLSPLYSLIKTSEQHAIELINDGTFDKKIPLEYSLEEVGVEIIEQCVKQCIIDNLTIILQSIFSGTCQVGVLPKELVNDDLKQHIENLKVFDERPLGKGFIPPEAT